MDLGQICDIRRIVLYWETASAAEYQIQVSDNATSWTTLYSAASGTLVVTSISSGRMDELSLSGSGRYVRMYGTKRVTPYGFSLWEFEVYGS